MLDSAKATLNEILQTLEKKTEPKSAKTTNTNISFKRFVAQSLFKTGKQRQIELLTTFGRTASTNLRMSPEQEAEKDVDFQDEKYRLKNLCFKQRRKKKDLSKRRRRHMSQDCVKESSNIEKSKFSTFQKKTIPSQISANQNQAVHNQQGYLGLIEKDMYFYDYCLEFLDKNQREKIEKVKKNDIFVENNNINKSCLLERNDLINLNTQLRHILEKAVIKSFEEEQEISDEEQNTNQEQEILSTFEDLLDFLRNIALMITSYCLEMLISFKNESVYPSLLLDLKIVKKFKEEGYNFQELSPDYLDMQIEMLKGLYFEIQSLISISFDLKDKLDLVAVQIFQKMATNWCICVSDNIEMVFVKQEKHIDKQLQILNFRSNDVIEKVGKQLAQKKKVDREQIMAEILAKIT